MATIFCAQCQRPIPKGMFYITKPTGYYCAACIKTWPAPKLRGLVNGVVLLLCLASPALGDIRGCTAVSTVSGSVMYEKVVAVGVNPQHTAYWVYYPDRKQVKSPDGHYHAEPLDIDQFIADGKLGHTQTGKPVHCPQELWH